MKKLFAILLAVCMVCSLAACGSEKPQEAAQDSSQKLVVWIEKIFSDEANEYMCDRVEAFGAEKGIEVVCELVPASDFVTKLNATIEAGAGVPDIISADTTRVVNYYPQIPCVDVSDLVAEVNETRPYFEAAFEGTKIGGAHYYLPFCSSTTLMFVRKDKLEAAGITEMPRTWDDVEAAARAVTDPDNDFYGLGMGCGDTDDDDENMFRQWVWNEGGSLFDKEGSIIAADGVFAEVANKYGSLYTDKVIPPDATTWDSGGNNGSYLAGRTAIVFNAPTLYNALVSNEEYKDLLANTYVAAPPVGSANGIYMNFNRGYAIMNTCKDTELAKEFLRYMIDKEWYDSYMEKVAPIFAPIFQDEKDNPVWQEGANKEVLTYAEHASGYYGWPVETLEGRAVGAKHYYSFPFEKVFNQVATGTATAEAAIAEQIDIMEDLALSIK